MQRLVQRRLRQDALFDLQSMSLCQRKPSMIFGDMQMCCLEAQCCQQCRTPSCLCTYVNEMLLPACIRNSGRFTLVLTTVYVVVA